MNESRLVLSVSWIIIILGLIFVSLPLYWLIITAFKTMDAVLHRPPYFLPPKWTLSNFTETVFGTRGLGLPAALSGIKSSLIVASCNSILSLFIGLLAAFSISRFKTGGKNLSFWILSNRFLPPIVFIIPLFIIFKKLHLFDTYAGLILVYTIFNVPFATWLLMGFISESPEELEEAAMMDGATRLGALFRITIPIILPGVVVTLLFCFLFAWNEYIIALLLTGTKIDTLPVIIPKYTAAHDVVYSQMAAVSLMGIVPAVLLAFFLQRYLVRGLTVGAIR